MKKQVKKPSLERQIAASIEIIATERDKLRKLVNEAAEAADVSDRAIARLEEAVDILSEVL